MTRSVDLPSLRRGGGTLASMPTAARRKVKPRRGDCSGFLPWYLSQGATGIDGYFHMRPRMLRNSVDQLQMILASTVHPTILFDEKPGKGSGPTNVEMHRVLGSSWVRPERRQRGACLVDFRLRFRRPADSHVCPV